MINVLIIGLSPNIGGIESFVFNVIKNANKNEFSFTLLNHSEESLCFEEEFIKFGCKIEKITLRTKNYFKHIKELNKILKNNYDIIHINMMSYSWFEPILISKNTKAKVILHSHSANLSNQYSKKTSFLNRIGRNIVNVSKYNLVACGVEAGKNMFNTDNFLVLKNGINFEKYSYKYEVRNKLRKEYKIKDNEFIVGLVAKLESQKNVLFLIDIFYELYKLNNNSKLILIGDGSLKSDIIKKIEEYNIKDKVLLLGKKEDTFNYYNMFDTFVMPSLFEGISISIIEAQANGLFCYTSNRVDKNCNITGNVKFISLDESAKRWAELI